MLSSKYKAFIVTSTVLYNDILYLPSTMNTVLLIVKYIKLELNLT